MLVNLALGLATMVVCLVLQTLLVVAATRYYVSRRPTAGVPSLGSGLAMLSTLLLILVLGNLAQVGMWGWVFLRLGEFEGFADAFYHSMVNFTTLGYGDVVMSPAHRLLGAMEAVNGVLMFGVSAAALFAAFQDLLRRGHRGAR